MKVIKILFLLLMIGILMIGVCGCMDNKNLAERMKDLALDYLTRSYDDSFVAKSFSTENWAYNYSTVIFYSEKYDEAQIEVRIYKNEDGSYMFRDNYFRYFLQAEAVEWFGEFFTDENVVIKIRFPGSVWSDDLAGAKTFLDWKNTGCCVVDVYVFCENDLLEEKKNDFVGLMVSEKIQGNVSFCGVLEINNISNISLDEILNNQARFIESKSKYHIDNTFEVEKVN